MNTHNPYSPPRAPVADIPQADPTRAKRSLMPLWLASLYCLAIGVAHLFMLATALYRARELLEWPMPPWVYMLGFIQPATRIAGGVSFIRRSRFSPELLLAMAVIAVVFPILWAVLGPGRLPSGPLLGLSLADLTLLVLITRYAFALRQRGVLR